MCLHAVNLIDPPGKRKTFHLVQKTESAVRTAVRHYGLTEQAALFSHEVECPL